MQQNNKSIRIDIAIAEYLKSLSLNLGEYNAMFVDLQKLLDLKKIYGRTDKLAALFDEYVNNNFVGKNENNKLMGILDFPSVAAPSC